MSVGQFSATAVDLVVGRIGSKVFFRDGGPNRGPAGATPQREARRVGKTDHDLGVLPGAVEVSIQVKATKADMLIVPKSYDAQLWTKNQTKQRRRDRPDK